MQDAELLLSLAGIAGVFVGFGALIAVRGGGATDTAEVAYMRAVVSAGMLAIVAALAPVTLDRFGLSEHVVWVLSALLVLAGWVVIIIAMARTPEYRSNAAASLEADRTRPRWLVALESIAWLLYVAAMVLCPVFIVLGVAPQIEAALYSAVVELILLGAGWTLLFLVFMQRLPLSAQETRPAGSAVSAPGRSESAR